jgi:hypothetical protein
VQALAWGYTATGNQAFKELVLPLVLQQKPRAARLLHPTLGWCPAYHKGCSYAAGSLSKLHKNVCFHVMARQCEQRLLALELWHLLPWQLEVLQQQHQLKDEQEQSQRPQAGSSSGDRPPGSSSSNSWHKPDMVFTVTWPLLPQAMLRLKGNSSSGNSSSSSSNSNSRQLPPPPTCQLPPVTQQQLQVALERVCVTVQLSPQDTRSSLLLLVLLLLRAELPQRLAFLQGPWGGLLLAALQLFARGRTPLHDAVAAVDSALKLEGDMGWYVSRIPGFLGFAEVLYSIGAPVGGALGTTAGCALSWLLLQPKGTVDVGSDHSSSSSIERHVGSSEVSGTSNTGSSSSSSSSTGRSGSSTAAAADTCPGTGEFWAPGPWVHFGTAKPPTGAVTGSLAVMMCHQGSVLRQ